MTGTERVKENFAERTLEGNFALREVGGRRGIKTDSGLTLCLIGMEGRLKKNTGKRENSRSPGRFAAYLRTPGVT